MVPEGWEKRTLASLADYHNGRAFKPHDWGKEGLPIIRIAQMTNPIAKTDFYSGDDIVAKHKINNGDMLFSWSATLAVMLWNRGPAVLNQHIFKVEEKPGIDSDFLYHLLNNSIDALAEHSHGSTMKHIKKGVLKDFIVPIPSLHEQKKIAAILNSVDNAIQATQAVIDQTRRVKQGLMQQLLTRGIGHTRFRQTEIGEIPEEWCIKTAKEVCSKISVGIVVKPTQYYESNGIKCFRSANVREGYIEDQDWVYISEEANNLNAKSKLQSGDVLIVRTGYPGTSCVVPQEYEGTNCIDILFARPKVEIILSHYLSCFINSSLGKKQVLYGQGGLAQKHFNVNALNQMKIVLPSIYEQKKITTILTNMDNVLNIELDKMVQIQKIKRGLMQDLLTGRVRVKPDELNTT